MNGQLVALDQAIEVISHKPSIMELMEAITKAKQVKFLTIQNDEQKAETAKKLLNLKEVISIGEALSKEERDPYFQMSKRIKGFFDDALKPIAEFDGRGRIISGKIKEAEDRLNDYRIKLKKQEEDERRKAQAKLDNIREKNPDIADKIPETVTVAPKEIKTKVEEGTVYTKQVLHIRIADVKAMHGAVSAGAVPEGVFEVKEGYVKTLIKGGMKIPGVESWYEDEIQTRR